MINVATISDLREAVQNARAAGKRIGCVPTMGALHPGHLSLVSVARQESDFVVVTIFVNPTQFGPYEDLEKYPRPLANDLAKCRDAGVDLVFHPEVADVYPRENATFVEVPGLSDVLEGAFRPGHFRGVTTIVLKLFNMVQPDISFFGQKDFQQQLMIRHMVRDLDVPVEIQTCPTIRESDGLAMSSRNVYLSPDERHSSLRLSRALTDAKNQIEDHGVCPRAACENLQAELSEADGIDLDYATIVDAVTLTEVDDSTRPDCDLVALVAARVGSTRLIDNVPIRSPTSG